MALKLTERQQATIFAAAVILAVAGLYAYIQSIQPPSVASVGTFRASLVINGNGWTVSYRNVTTTNNTVFGILLEASQRLGFQVKWINYTVPAGVFVTAINGTANGQGGKYWEYWVNGILGDRAADKKQIVDGDLVLWAFVVPTEGG